MNKPVQGEFSLPSPATHSSRFPLSLQIAGEVYRMIRLENYSFGDAFNEMAHRHRIFRSEQKQLYDKLKEEVRKFCDDRDPFLTLFAWTRPRDNHKKTVQPYALNHRTRLKPGIETEVLL